MHYEKLCIIGLFIMRYLTVYWFNFNVTIFPNVGYVNNDIIILNQYFVCLNMDLNEVQSSPSICVEHMMEIALNIYHWVWH